MSFGSKPRNETTIKNGGTMSYYTELEKARTMPGMRLVTTAGVPGPWGEAAKAIMHIKKIPVVNVMQAGGQENPELVAWTGINSGPIAIWNEERPRANWVDILMLAERLQPEPSLIPRDERDRAWMFGLAHELCSEDGYGWNRRLVFFNGWDQAATANPALHGDASIIRMREKYDPGTPVGHARQRILDIVTLLATQLSEQKAKGSRYYIGNQLSALDIYAAMFTAMIKPLPIEQCPASPEMHYGYHDFDPQVTDIAAPLLAHRDFIYQTYLELPMKF